MVLFYRKKKKKTKELENKIKVGIRVEVPFRSQRLEGFVLEIKDKSSLELKEIIGMFLPDFMYKIFDHLPIPFENDNLEYPH